MIGDFSAFAAPATRAPAPSAKSAAPSAPASTEPAPALPETGSVIKPPSGSVGPQARLVRILTKGKYIRDMAFKGTTAPIHLVQSQPGTEPVAVIEGRFPRFGWNLVFDTYAVFTPQPGKDSFRVSIPIGDDITVVKVTAVGPKGDTEIEKFFIQVAGGRKALLEFLLGKKQELEEDDKSSRPADWSLLARAAPAVGSYRYGEPDANGSPTSAGSFTTVAFSSELRWRGPKSAGQHWTWSGSLNLEVLSQTILGKAFTMPRYYGRVFVGREVDKWRLGPFLQIHGGPSTVATVDPTQVTFRAGTVNRKGGAIGGVAVFRPAPSMGFSGLLLFRLDTGGIIPPCTPGLIGCTSTVLSAKSSLGWEAGFGIVIGLSTKLYLETRIRALYEKVSWTPANGSTLPAFVSNTYAIFDVGLGYRF